MCSTVVSPDLCGVSFLPFLPITSICALCVSLLLQVVQVFTYMLSPLMTPGDAQQHTNQQHQQQDAAGDKGLMSGWSLRIVMEWMDQVRHQGSWGNRQLDPLLALCCQC